MVRVLIVDDNTDITDSVKMVMEEKDSSITVDIANSGEECIKYLSEKNYPDAIIMDVMMPGIDGIETSIRVKENPDYKNIPIIFLTAKTDKMTRSMGEISGEAFIEKPFDLDVLYDKIMEVTK